MLSVLLVQTAKAQSNFITVEDGLLMNGSEPYFFLGANFWYGMNLGVEGEHGDRERLKRELDHLQSLGVKNLRIMGSSEGADTVSIRVNKSLLVAPGVYDESVFKGLDFLLDQLEKRDMKAVLCVNNFWAWTGGMSQYLSWANKDTIPYHPPAENGDWDLFQRYSSSFYGDKKANGLFYDHLTVLINRKNTYTGKLYKDDPVIMAWQLANEPRGYTNVDAYRLWLHETAGFIKSLDSAHLVSIGTEGNTSNTFAGTDFYQDHQSEHIDYATVHIWVQNWSWFDPEKDVETLPDAIQKAKDYLQQHVEAAGKLNKPLVLEEFGIGRDKGDYSHQAPVSLRNEYFREMFHSVYTYARSGSMSGANFWSWSGEGRPSAPGALWRFGDELTGDPPHERQGWYSVYDTDSSTIEIIKHYADLMTGVNSEIVK